MPSPVSPTEVQLPSPGGRHSPLRIPSLRTREPGHPTPMCKHTQRDAHVHSSDPCSLFHAHTHPCACTGPHAPYGIHIHAHVQAPEHVLTLPLSHTCKHAYVHAPVHTLSLSNTHTCTHHTCTHLHVCMCTCSCAGTLTHTRP